MLYDLAQFHDWYGERECEVGVEIVPCRAWLSRLGVLAADGEQLIKTLEVRSGQSTIAPVAVILIDADD